MNGDRTYGWRRELPWIGLPVVAGTLARLPFLTHAASIFDSDTAQGALMSSAIGDDGYWPLMLTGQDYHGAADAYLGVPFVALTGDLPTGWVLTNMVILGLALLPVCYRLFHLLGGRVGALAGTLYIAVGPPWLVVLTAGAGLAYLSNLALGGLILLYGMSTVRGPKPRRLLVLGLLVGAAWWNNPQVAVFVAPVIVGWWTAGRLCGLRREGRLSDALRGRSGQAVRWFLIVAVVVFGFVLVLPFIGPFELIGISMKRPYRYFPRGVALLGLALVTAELYLAADRREWLRRAGRFGVGAVLGGSPILLYKLLGRTTGIKPWMEFRPDRVPSHWNYFSTHGGQVVFGTDTPGRAPAWIEPAEPALLTLFVCMAACAVLALLWHHRDQLVGMLTLRPAVLADPLAFVLPGILLSAILLIRGDFMGGHRHFLPLSVPCAALVAWFAGWLHRRRRWLALVVLSPAALYLAIGQAKMPTMVEWWDSPRIEEQRMIDTLVAEGVRNGEGGYWVAFKISQRSNRKLLIWCDYDYMGNLQRFPRWKPIVKADPEPVYIFNTTKPHEPERMAAFIDTHGDRIARRWRFGDRYHVFRWRR